MKYVVWGLVVLLLVLHQDYWQWNDATLVFGFLPSAIAYHAALSIAAAVAWGLAIRFCWPRDIDRTESFVETESVEPSNAHSPEQNE